MKTFKDFKFLRLLGQGSFGDIYLTQKGKDSKLIAAKILNKSDYKGAWKKMLEREKQLLKEMNHPNIIKYYNELEGEDDKYYYLFMEYCNGGNLKEALDKYKSKYKKENFSLETVQYLMRKIIQGVKYIHSKNVVHRDIKLENILLSFNTEDDIKNLNIKNAEVKIIDFGVARKLDSKGEASTITGSPFTMDPLILKQHVTKKEKIDEYDERVDIWSLGVIFYQLLTGKKLFKVKTLEELMAKVEEGNYTIPIKTLLYKETISFINLMLQYNKEKRYSLNELCEHNFITKEIKHFNKINIEDINQIIYLIDENGLNINTKNNDPIYRIFNCGNGEFNKLGISQVFRKDKRNTKEEEILFVCYGNIFTKNNEDKVNNIMKILKNEEKEVFYDKENDKNEIKKYLNGLLEEYKSVKEYFNKYGFKNQEEDANNKIIQIQKIIQNFEQNPEISINYESIPKPIFPEYIYNCPTSKRNSIFNQILDVYNAAKKNREISLKNTKIKLNQTDKKLLSLIQNSLCEKIKNDEQKISKYKKILEAIETNYNNVWAPPPEIEEDLKYVENEMITYEGCEFKMIIKTTITNYNNAIKLLLRYNMKINDSKNFFGEFKNYGYSDEQIIWNLNDKEWNNLSNYFIKIDFFYDTKYNQSINLNIASLKDENEINTKHIIKFDNIKEDIVFNFNIKIIMPQGKIKTIKKMKKITKVKRSFSPFKGKSPDTEKIPSLFISQK